MKDYSQYFKGPNLQEAKKRSHQQVDHLDDVFEIPADMVNVGRGKKYYIHTYGCQANERDSETLAGILEMLGYDQSDDIKEADVILLNTCAIRENAEEKVFGKVGYVKNLKKNNPDLIFGLCGCMAQEEVVIQRILECVENYNAELWLAKQHQELVAEYQHMLDDDGLINQDELKSIEHILDRFEKILDAHQEERIKRANLYERAKDEFAKKQQANEEKLSKLYEELNRYLEEMKND